MRLCVALATREDQRIAAERRECPEKVIPKAQETPCCRVKWQALPRHMGGGWDATAGEFWKVVPGNDRFPSS